MQPNSSLVLIILAASSVVPFAAASEFAAAEASASGHAADALAATTVAVAEADLRCHLHRLASEEYEGRGTADRGGRMATAYVASFMEGLGLRPDGDDGTWFQEFDFPAGMALVGDNSMTLRIDEPVGLVRRFRPGEHYQPLSVSTGGKVDAGVVFAGFGIGTKDYNSFDEIDAKGRWLIVLRGHPKDRKELARHGSIVAKVKAAKKAGAAGVILVKGGNDAVPNELVSPEASVGSREQLLPALTITDRLAAAMLTGSDDPERLQALCAAYQVGERVRGFSLPFRLSAEIGIEAREDTGRNVLARLQSGDAPSAEVIVIGAHIDHLGRGDRGGSRAKGEDSGRIHFGADDNASGVAAMMEIAQVLAGRHQRGELQLRRDIIFAAWSGEELGLRGSKRFIEAAKEEREELYPAIAACLNMDMVGRAEDKGLGIHGTASSKAWSGILDSVEPVEGLEVKRSENPYVPTDSVAFYRAGVPILAAFTGLNDDYHTPADTVDKIDFAGLDRIACYMSGLAVQVANAPEVPDYVEVPRGGKQGAPKVRLGLRLGIHKDGGVLLTEVVADSAASRAGLRAGDVLVQLNRKEVEDSADLMAVVRTLKAKRDYPARVRRDGGEVEVTIVPDAR